MASEIFRRETMRDQTARSDYVGALIDGERRMVLVGVDPENPWEAFRRLRKQMRRERKPATVALYGADAPLEHQADVIDLSSRRRAG